MFAMTTREATSNSNGSKSAEESQVAGDGGLEIAESSVMTQKRTWAWRRSSSGRSFLQAWVGTIALVVVSLSSAGVSAEGSIGCLFAHSLCINGVEFCYDDFAFGKCVARFEHDPEDMRRSRLTMGQTKILATMLQEMEGAGLTWDHPFVQCRMQGALFALRERTPMPPNLCGHLAPPPQILGPQSPLAYVRFTVPEEEEDGYREQEEDPQEYLGEIVRAQKGLYPMQKKSVSPISERVFMVPPPLNRYAAEELGNNYDDLEILDRLAKQQEDVEEEEENAVPMNVRDLLDRYQLQQLMRAAEEKALKEEDPILPISRGASSFFHERQQQLEEDALNEVLHETEDVGEREDIPVQDVLKRKSAGPSWEEGQAQKPDEDNNQEKPHTSFREVSRVEHIPAVSFYREPHQVFEDSDWVKDSASAPIVPIPNEGEGETEEEDDKGIFAEEPVAMPSSNVAGSGIYTEGGVVFLPNSGSSTIDEQDEGDTREEARDLLANMLGFTRHERLDVKKPGPLVVPPESPGATASKNATTTKSTPVSEQNKEILPKNFVSPAKAKKLVAEGHQSADHGVHSVDSEFAHVKLSTPVESWEDGIRIIQAIADQVDLSPYFSHHRVDRHEVAFRVDPNPEKKTASDVVRAINDSRFKMNLSRRLGVKVLYAGIGDKTQEASEWSEQMSKKMVSLTQGGGIDSTHLMVYMFVGAGVAAILVAVITLFVIKRHDKVKSKLVSLAESVGMGVGGVDSSKDYQELCRARMAGKTAGNGSGQGNEAAGTVTSGRITTLSKENERPPSSRSSTSSWSEEPITNMDISTGHMVLSYMEDHLRNKGRLQREWEALCRYEAEPNSREAAMLETSEKLNRDGAPLPYDHSRVVLNHLANADGLDYINASTITDHDPRAPAYVAAQGPMQSTVAHFWQMIWEQGTVVIVALCRLQENGEISCTRYWPEEGAETYNIYEVHLVSEHIWCDDYLVRSFYLKNLQTGETRTVTQFHFLTWPQMGVPASAKPLLEFRRKVNKSYRGRSCPIVVHSGNGAGRAGAYILLDLVLGRMNKGAREIDIAATLEHLRDQRAGLVETRPQFEFVLMAVAEEVHAILKALPNTTSTEKRDIDKDPIKEEEPNPKGAVEKKKADSVEKAEKEKGEKGEKGEKTTATTSGGKK